MPIVRGRHHFDDHFTQIPNAWLRDPRISFKARGILAELLSHTVGFEVTIASLAREGQEGRDSISSGIIELERAGYLRREQARGDGGRFAEAIWTTQDPFARGNPRSEPITDYPATAEPLPANPHPKKNNSKNTTSKKLRSPEATGATEESFEEFWAIYPKRAAIADARKAFAKAVGIHGLETILDGARRVAADPNLPEKRFIPHPATWLNREGWNDEPYPARSRTPEELAELARRKAEREREAARREREQRMLLEEAAVPAPPCEHGIPLWKCLPCSKRLAAEQNAT